MHHAPGLRNSRRRHLEVVREQADGGLVGFAVDWWRRCSDAKPAILYGLDGIAARPWLDADIDEQVRAFARNGRQIGNGRKVDR